MIVKRGKSRMSGVQAKKWLSILGEINRFLLSFTFDSLKGKHGEHKRPLGRPILSSFFEAYNATLSYYVRLTNGSERSRGEEAHIGRLWQKLGTKIARLDEKLGKQLKANGDLFVCDSIWTKAVIQKSWLLLNGLRTNANLANANNPEVQRMLHWKSMLGSTK